MKRKLFLLSSKPERFTDTAVLMEEEGLAVETAESIPALEEQCRKNPCPAVMLDLDTASVDNRTLKNLSRQFPGLLLFAVSKRRFHPDLQESLQSCIFACLRYPIDPEELLIVLKGIGDPSLDGQGQPVLPG